MDILGEDDKGDEYEDNEDDGDEDKDDKENEYKDGKDEVKKNDVPKKESHNKQPAADITGKDDKDDEDE